MSIFRILGGLWGQIRVVVACQVAFHACLQLTQTLYLPQGYEIVLQLLILTVEAPHQPNVWAEQKKIGEKLVFPPDDCCCCHLSNLRLECKLQLSEDRI